MGLAIAFWLLAAVAVIGALGVVILRNVFRSALSLILCFLAIAGIYITLQAEFLAAIQILIYIGAISILIILAIMLTRNLPQGSPGNRLAIPAFIAGAAFLGIVVWALLGTSWPLSTAPVSPMNTEQIGQQLLGQSGYVLPVLIAPMLLLAAVLGAVVLAREK